jgi:shikimate kinase
MVLWLDAPSSVLAERLSAAAGAARPLLGADPFAALERLRGEREHLYALCGRRIDTHKRTPEDEMDDRLARTANRDKRTGT